MTFCELLLQPILGVVGRKYVNFSLSVNKFFDAFDGEKPITLTKIHPKCSRKNPLKISWFG